MDADADEDYARACRWRSRAPLLVRKGARTAAAAAAGGGSNGGSRGGSGGGARAGRWSRTEGGASRDAGARDAGSEFVALGKESAAHTAAREDAFWQERAAFERAAADAGRAARKPTVERLAEFCAAAENLDGAGVAIGSAAASAQGLPTAVTICGGINSVDAPAVAQLCEVLRARGHAVASVPARSLRGTNASGAGLAALLRLSGTSMLAGEKALREQQAAHRTSASGDKTDAAVARAPASAAAGGASKGRRNGRSTRSPAPAPSAKKKKDGKAADGASADTARLEEKHWVTGGMWDVSSIARWRAAEKGGRGALVWVLDGTERLDPDALTDLLTLLADAREHRGLPVCVITLLQTSAGTLQQVLPAATAQRLAPTVFSFATPAQCVDALLERTLLATAPGASAAGEQGAGTSHDAPALLAPVLGLSGACVHGLQQSFICHHSLASYVEQVCATARAAHFTSHPLASLAAPAACASKSALQAAIKAAPAAAVAALAKEARVGAKALPGALWEMLERRRARALALRWVASCGSASLLELLVAVSDDGEEDDEDEDAGEPRGSQELRDAVHALRAMGAPGGRAPGQAERGGRGDGTGADAQARLSQLMAVLRQWVRVPAPAQVEAHVEAARTLLAEAERATGATATAMVGAPDTAQTAEMEKVAAARRGRGKAAASKGGKSGAKARVKAAAASKGEDAAATTTALRPKDIADRAADLLSAVGRAHMLSADPLEGALGAAWRFDGWQTVADALHPAPRSRAMAHMAAGAPSVSARGGGRNGGVRPLASVDCAMDDTAMAWALLSAHGENASVARWYREMCHVYIKGGQCGAQSGRGRGRKRKAATATEASEVDDALTALAARDRATLQARFSRAAGELQLMGAIRSASKRSDTVQRLVFDAM